MCISNKPLGTVALSDGAKSSHKAKRFPHRACRRPVPHPHRRVSDSEAPDTEPGAGRLGDPTTVTPPRRQTWTGLLWGSMDG